MNIKTYLADRIFTGNEMLHHHAIVVKDDVIIDIVDADKIDADSNIINYNNALIAPAFIDLQLYGAHNRLLSAYPDATSVGAIYDYSKFGGCSHCMPTVATNTYETIFKCIDAIKDYWNAGRHGILGLHVEGPWISIAKRGAHNIEWIFSPTIQQAKELLEYGKDVIKIITLAPEVCSDDI